LRKKMFQSQSNSKFTNFAARSAEEIFSPRGVGPPLSGRARKFFGMIFRKKNRYAAKVSLLPDFFFEVPFKKNLKKFFRLKKLYRFFLVWPREARKKFFRLGGPSPPAGALANFLV